MICEVGARSKPLLAKLAAIGLNSQMTSYVENDIGFLSEPLKTVLMSTWRSNVV